MGFAFPPDRIFREFREDILLVVFANLAIAQVFPEYALTSWYRDEISNRRVGGAEFSQHRLALATDGVGLDDDQVAAAVPFLRSVGLVAVDEGSHLHIQRFPARTLPPSVFRV